MDHNNQSAEKPLTFEDLYTGDRFKIGETLWTKIDSETARKHGASELNLRERGYGYHGSAICSFGPDDAVEFVPACSTPHPSLSPDVRESLYLVIGQEDGMESFLCRESELLNGVLRALFYEHTDCSLEECAYWKAQLADNDNWIIHDGKHEHFNQGIGEIGQLDVYRVTDSSLISELAAELTGQESELKLIQERDEAEEWADKLSLAIASRSEIGEHSNQNNPWQNAIDLADSIHSQHAQELAKMREELETTSKHLWNAGIELNTLRTTLSAVEAERDALKNRVPEECTLHAYFEGEGWELDVRDSDGELLGMLAWPKSWPSTMNAEQLRKMGFEIV